MNKMLYVLNLQLANFSWVPLLALCGRLHNFDKPPGHLPVTTTLLLHHLVVLSLR